MEHCRCRLGFVVFRSSKTLKAKTDVSFSWLKISVVIPTIVSNATIETFGTISEMLFMGIEGNNAVNLS